VFDQRINLLETAVVKKSSSRSRAVIFPRVVLGLNTRLGRRQPHSEPCDFSGPWVALRCL